MHSLKQFGPLTGRILIAVIFLLSGFGKLTGNAATTAYIASKGLPAPSILAVCAGVLELGGGLLLVVGYKTRWVAIALAIFTVIAALIFHNFWAVPADQARNQMIHFLKNIAMIGGMLYVITYGSGPMAFDSRGDTT
jgi:putative oxidoreductase